MKGHADSNTHEEMGDDYHTSVTQEEEYQESYERASADLELLDAAYPDEIQIHNTSGDDEDEEDNPIPSCFPLVFTLTLPNCLNNTTTSSNFGLNITMEFIKGYPTDETLKIVSYRGSSSSNKDHVEATVSAIRNTAKDNLGIECGFACCATAIETWQSFLEEEDANSQNMPSLTGVPVDNENDDDIVWISASNTLVDRKSTFQAHICAVSSEDMVRGAVNKLIQGSSRIQRATHNMYAYRFSDTQPDGRVVLKHDNDDDGEDAAGSRLAHLLQMRNDDGVLVLVSRWYGGIHLGPKRFAHIVNSARELLVECCDNGTLGRSKK